MEGWIHFLFLCIYTIFKLTYIHITGLEGSEKIFFFVIRLCDVF